EAQVKEESRWNKIVPEHAVATSKKFYLYELPWLNRQCMYSRCFSEAAITSARNCRGNWSIPDVVTVNFNPSAGRLRNYLHLFRRWRITPVARGEFLMPLHCFLMPTRTLLAFIFATNEQKDSEGQRNAWGVQYFHRGGAGVGDSNGKEPCC